MRGHTRDVESEAQDSFTWAALAIITLGALLRLYTIVSFSWDQDELYTRIEARDLFHTTLPPGIDARPLYYLLQHPLLSLLPQSAVALRVLPFLFGVAGLWVTWLAGRRHLGQAGGLVAVFLASTSTWHMEASGQARYYSLVYLLAALVLLWLPEAIERDRGSLYRATFAALTLGTLTHPSFLFPMFGYALGVSLVMPNGRIGFRWPSRNAWTRLWGPYLGFLALFAGILKLAHRQSAIRNLGGRGMAATLRLVPAIVEWITPAVFGAATVAAICLLFTRSSRQRQLGSMLLVAVSVTLAGLFVASFWTGIYAVYATALLPIVFVTAASLTQLGSSASTGARRSGRNAAAAVAVFGIAVAPVLLSHLSDGSRFDYRPAYRQIEHEAPAIPVVTWPVVLAQEYAPKLEVLPLKPERAYLDQTLARYGDLWVITSVKRAGIALDDFGDVDQWLPVHCQRRGVFERPRFDYRVYRVELYRCADRLARLAGS